MNLKQALEMDKPKGPLEEQNPDVQISSNAVEVSPAYMAAAQEVML